jgi:CBS-domain-containing membrane protein
VVTVQKKVLTELNKNEKKCPAIAAGHFFLNCHTAHTSAFFGTLVTDFRTFAAMLVVMLGTFIPTFVTNLGANSANLFGTAAS